MTYPKPHWREEYFRNLGVASVLKPTLVFSRRTFWAKWMAERFGIEIDEVGRRPAAPEGGQLRLF